MVTAVLDRIVPPNEKMPGAGTIAVDYLDQTVGGSARLRQIFGRGLAHIEVRAYAAHKNDFTTLSGEHMDTVLRQVEADDPEFSRLIPSPDCPDSSCRVDPVVSMNSRQRMLEKIARNQ